MFTKAAMNAWGKRELSRAFLRNHNTAIVLSVVVAKSFEIEAPIAVGVYVKSLVVILSMFSSMDPVVPICCTFSIERACP